MKRWIPALVLSATVAVMVGSPVRAQSSNGAIVAVMDLAKVFEKHPKLQAEIKRIQEEYKQFQEDAIAKQKALQNRVKQLQQLKQGTPDYKKLQAEIAKADSDRAVDQRLKQGEFMQREARAHYNAYMEVLSAVQRVCTRHNISLVLRYDSKPIDPDDGNSIMRGITRNVVYQRQLDITDLVVRELFATAQQPGSLPRRQ